MTAKLLVTPPLRQVPTSPEHGLTLASEERYQAFIQNSHEGIWRCELDTPIAIDLPPDEQIALIFERGYLAETNDAMATMYGLQSAADLVGARLSALLIQDDPRNIAYLRAFIASGYALSGVESHELDHDGNEKVFRNSLVGVMQDGYVLRAWGTQQDITEQYHAQLALRASEERLAMALKASKMGMWEWNIAEDTYVWSDDMKALFGLKPTEEITYEAYIGMVHPEDRAAVVSALDTAIRTGGDFRIERRIVWADGSVHWLLGQGRAFRKDGKPTRITGTCLNIDDTKRAEELRVANTALTLKQEQLEALSKSKDEFISLASHQLRTPATVVKQYLGMLLQGFKGPVNPEHVAFMQMAYDNNERQLQIINDLLRVARVDAGKVVLHKEETDLKALLGEVVREQTVTFETHGQHLVFKKTPKVQVLVDSARLRMVLDNVLENACKYSQHGATTTVHLEADKKSIVISIQDQGVGIAKKDIPKLFQKFSRVDNALSLQVGGTGIGLYWAKKIIDLHGGSITVESRLHKGSTFQITLPR